MRDGAFLIEAPAAVEDRLLRVERILGCARLELRFLHFLRHGCPRRRFVVRLRQFVRGAVFGGRAFEIPVLQLQQQLPRAGRRGLLVIPSRSTRGREDVLDDVALGLRIAVHRHVAQKGQQLGGAVASRLELE